MESGRAQLEARPGNRRPRTQADREERNHSPTHGDDLPERRRDRHPRATRTCPVRSKWRQPPPAD